MKKFTDLMQLQLLKLVATGMLFRASIKGDELWKIYMKGFGIDPIYRDPSSSVHNCNLCNNFIRRYGNTVAIDGNGNIITLFDFDIDGEFADVANLLSTTLKNSSIENVFFETFNELNSLNYEKCKKDNSTFRLGIAKNIKTYTVSEANNYCNNENVQKALYLENQYNLLKSNDTKDEEKLTEVRTELKLVVKDWRIDPTEIYSFNHMHLDLPVKFVDMTGKSIESIMADYRSDKEVFQRTMESISIDTYDLAIELIEYKMLRNADKYVSALKQYIEFKKGYELATNKDNYCWTTAYKLKDGFAKFGNSNIGTGFLYAYEKDTDDLDTICSKFNYREDPDNKYQGSTEVPDSIKLKTLKVIEDLDIVSQFTERRHATNNDIDINTVGYTNNIPNKVVNIFNIDSDNDNKLYSPEDFTKVPVISIDDFMKQVGKYESIELLLESTMALFNMTAAINPDLPSIFKYGNNFSFTVNGNSAGESEIKKEVRNKGGNVSGFMMLHLGWNKNQSNDNSDLDLWCDQPDGTKIGFNTDFRKDKGDNFTSMSGQLDVDDRGYNNDLHVENIYFLNRNQLKDGNYKFWVNQYSPKNSKGFESEFVLNGESYYYTYNKPLRDKENVHICTVNLKNGVFTIQHHISYVTISKKLWNLDTLKFHKVSCICPSPNYWDTQSGTLHHLFAIHGCHNENPIKTFHIDNLIPSLLPYRKSLNVLADITKIPADGKQFAGVCFNGTYEREIICRVTKDGKKSVIRVRINMPVSKTETIPSLIIN